jgi:hypothetical protein
MRKQDTEEVYSKNSNREPSELSLDGGPKPAQAAASVPAEAPKRKRNNLAELIEPGSVFGPNGFDATKFDGGQNSPVEFIKEVNVELAANTEARVREWYPGRKIEKSVENGVEWLKVGKNGGLKVCTDDGRWADHSEGSQGPGLVSLYAWEFNMKRFDAAKKLSNGASCTISTTRRKADPAPVQEAPVASYELARTKPDKAPTFSKGEPSHQYMYNTREGDFAMVVARFDQADGTKEIRQLAWLKDRDGAESWQVPSKQGKVPNLLYKGEQLAQYPDKPVLIVEGEKCVDAIADAWHKWIVLTWQGGSTTAGKADWSGFEGRNVTIWPDNDEPGTKAAAAIVEHIPHAKVVTPPTSAAPGWDLADAIESGWDNTQLYGLIESAAPAEVAAELTVGIWDQIPAAPISTPYVDLDVEPEADDFKAFLKDVPLAEDADLVVISARLKSFKSSIVAAMACSLVAGDDVDCLGLKIRGNGAVLIFDTEQSTKEIQNQSKAMRRRLGTMETPDRIKIVGLREYSPSDRMKIVKHAIEENKHGGIAAVVVDGASDLCGNVNDPEASSAVVSFLMVAASHAQAPLFGVIHLNHSDRDAMGGGRGHLGKEMERKAKSVICIEKDASGVGTIYAQTTRRQPISKDNGQRVEYCQTRHMVVSMHDTQAEIKQSQQAEEMMHLVDELKEVTGTHVWKYSQLWQTIASVEGLKERAAKKRIEKMLNAEVLHKSASGNYVARTGNGILSCDPTQS